MRTVARAVSILLLVSIIAALSSVPGASSQNITTITSLQTVTTEGSITRTATATIQSTSLTTFTSTYFTTSSLAQPKKIASTTFTLSAPGQQFGCIYSNQLGSFVAKAGEVVTGTIDSDSEVNFYLMTSHDYGVWVSKTSCGMDTALVQAEAVKTYSLEFVIPTDGRYRFLVLNFSHDKDAKVNLSAQVVGTATSSSAIITSTETSQDYSTQTVVVPATVTTIVTSLRTEQVGFSLEGSNLLLLAVGLAVVAVVVVFVALRSRGRKPKTVSDLTEAETEAPPIIPIPPPPKPAVSKRQVQTPPPGMKFCIHCGQAILLSARFCTNIDCGKPQN